jgi:hypothetical protein
MNKVNQLALAATATAALGAAITSNAMAGSSLNGPQVTGVAVPSLETNQPVVNAVRLPSGKAIDVHPQTAD